MRDYHCTITFPHILLPNTHFTLSLCCSTKSLSDNFSWNSASFSDTLLPKQELDKDNLISENVPHTQNILTTMVIE